MHGASASLEHYARVKREFDDAGVTVGSYYVNFDDTYTDAEVDAVFEGARALGAQGCVGSQGLGTTERLAPFPAKHGMFLGIHNHANLSDPDAFATEESFVKGLALSPAVRSELDTRHYTAANGDCIASFNTITNECRACTLATAAGTTDAARRLAREMPRSSKCSG